MSEWESLHLDNSLVGFKMTIIVYQSVVGDGKWTQEPIEHDVARKLSSPPLVNLPKFLRNLTKERKAK